MRKTHFLSFVSSWWSTESTFDLHQSYFVFVYLTRTICSRLGHVGGWRNGSTEAFNGRSWAFIGYVDHDGMNGNKWDDSCFQQGTIESLIFWIHWIATQENQRKRRLVIKKRKLQSIDWLSWIRIKSFMSHGLSIRPRNAQNVCNRTRLWILQIKKRDATILYFSVSQWTQHVSWEWCDKGELRILCSSSSSSLLFFDFLFSQRASKKIAFAFSLLVIVGICSVVGVLGLVAAAVFWFK